ncbi:MAG TPA: transcription-repair coupling factor [Candidatus Polarisedimenticolaceae bacterium]|nr:transcription-repair coupling factor [Candidatus Polarisedimenticolaceae bacterium]
MSTGPAVLAPLAGVPAFAALEGALTGDAPAAVTGLTGAARAAALTLGVHRTRRKALLVVPDDAALAAWHRDLAAFAALSGRDPQGIVTLPALDADPYDDIPPHPEVERERLRALGRLRRGELDLLIVPARALLSWLRSPEEIAATARVLSAGDDIAPDRFVLEALHAGYRRVDAVAAPGEISRRGGIVDVFPPESDEPVRIEWFGDTVESIRSFDPDHQRSTGVLSRAVIGPAIENAATDDAMARLGTYLEGGLLRAREADAPVGPFRAKLDALREGGHLPGIEALAKLTAARPTGVLEHAKALALVLDEPERIEEELARAGYEMRASYEQSGDRVLPPPAELFIPEGDVVEALREASLSFRELLTEESGPRTVAWPARRARTFAGRMAEFARELKESPGRVLCVLRAAGAAKRLVEIFGEYDVAATQDRTASAGVVVAVAGLREGFELPEQAFTVYTEREIFGEERATSERKSKGRASFLSDFRDLKIGDHVVHVDHGVARYAGLGRPKGGSLNRDFMILEFQGGDRLFVPTDRLDLVQKYSGVAGHEPALDRLGGTGWEKVKSRVRKAVESMAKELLELYARRQAASGHAFAPDGPWQAELESGFPFELTPDQERALGEVKGDMERAKPMDRLLVGDVGFGKTEVAVRAAFKAIMDGKQVALLAPTTVLAAQHFETIRERFAPFPVKVGMVSRFRSADETRILLRALAAGEVDMIVGTHRMLSQDVAFKNLGLMIVDEEQRFGVAAKERLKQLVLGVDVLSMTATPIPRTLQMSLAGVRDLSVIETPPPGRSAIQTYLVPFRKNVIAQAIRQEMRRSGQVFFVHNRVETIPSLVRALRELVPEARLVVAHGQMPERELERVMLRFVHDEFDVLVTTTLIENGLDIPRANTILVNRADRLGLAQLYQLRGRVGRSDQHAYAYFLIPGRQGLSESARKRLKALQEFSELGSGFRLAAADLEIRGAGEFLGSRQHGHIASLGFDLYCRMLEQAVAALTGEVAPTRPPVSLHLGIDIKIPDSFMSDVGDRLSLYKRLSATREPADVDRLQAETEDRWGHLPVAGKNLFDLTRLRLVAESAGVKSVDVVDAKLQVRFLAEAPVDPARLVDLVARRRGALTPSGMVTLPAPDKAADRIRAIRDVLQDAVAPPA